jgi:hypothetical protein
MAYEISTATGHYDLLAKIRTFVESTIPLAERYTVERSFTSTIAVVSSITRSGTTATVTTATAHSLWTGDSVTVSGASDGLYNGPFAVTVTGETTFTYTMTSTPAANASGTLVIARDNYEVIWKAPGLSGLEEIYFGIKTYQSISADYYNFKIGVFTGYVPGNSFETQPGVQGPMGVPLWNHNTPYWMAANGQRLIVFAKIENVYESFYMGKYLPYAIPSQYPYPVFCGGSLSTATATRYSDSSHQSWFKGTLANSRLRHVDGLWKTPDFHPCAGTHVLRNSNADSDVAEGYYSLNAITLSDSTPNVYGELDGVYFISGYNNAVENTGTYDSKPYVVMRNIWRTDFTDYVALRLE